MVAPQDASTLTEEQVLMGLNTWDRPEWGKLLLHPQFRHQWVVQFLKRQRAIGRQAIMDIYKNQQLRRRYKVCLALLLHRSTPIPIAISLVDVMRWGDLLTVLRQPRISGRIEMKCVQVIEDRYPRLTLGEQISIARKAPRQIVRAMRLSQNPQVLRILFLNPYFTYEDALFIASYPKSTPLALGALAQSPKWTRVKAIRRALIGHPRTPNHLILSLLRQMNAFELRNLIKDAGTPRFALRLAQRLLKGS